ncbi:thioredoxin domain-containing protein [Candidatus Saccharibacteria bacterium]|nr:thioredoxin domain-containing protein [Candidatus Saccharibacteria bacterium]
MKKILRIVGLIIIVVAIIAAITVSMNVKPSNSDRIWDEQTTIGNIDAKNYFIIYSDIMCPYCVAFENAIFENEEAFENYIKENDILVEVRLSDFLYEFGESRPINSRYSAEATYCAKKENKFWDYYRIAITTVWNDYFKDSGKSAFSEMNKLNKDYWIDLGKKIGLGEEFESCVKNDDPIKEIIANAEKTSKLINGMPYFKFNNYISSGFSLSWGWDYVQMYFQAGLDS